MHVGVRSRSGRKDETRRGSCTCQLFLSARGGRARKRQREGSAWCRAIANSQLTSQQFQQFQRDGFVALEGFASKAECEELKARANAIVQDFEPSTISIFSTTNQESTTNEYFMNSASQVSCFFEEGAFQPDGSLVQEKALSINKIGHALHDVDPVFRAFARSARMQTLYRELGFQRPLPVQSMYIFKQPAIGGRVVPHQDSSFLATEPYSCVGVWLALEDATLGNGCLWAARTGLDEPVRARMVRDGKGGVTWPDGTPDFSASEMEPLETRQGTLVLLRGSNVHGSEANQSAMSRHAFSMHVVEGTDDYTWLPDNWLQRPHDMPFEPLYDDAE